MRPGEQMKQILIIGGGAAGMMAAVFAAQEDTEVFLLEKNEKLGKKIYITGKGRCNVTNNCTDDIFLRLSYRTRAFYTAPTTVLHHRTPCPFLRKPELR